VGEPSVVIEATDKDLVPLSYVLGAAFVPVGPLWFVIPKLDERHRLAPQLAGLYLEWALQHGIVHTTEHRDSAALWLRLRRGEPLRLAGWPRRLQQVAGAYTDAIATFTAVQEAHHPAEPECYLLLALGVAAQRRNLGVGSALLAHMHDRLDAQAVPAYVQAADRGVSVFFHRRGYQRVGEQIRFGAQVLTALHPMWRPPRAGLAAVG
jgi:GNAT superfamily N-acetyltransferase